MTFKLLYFLAALFTCHFALADVSLQNKSENPSNALSQSVAMFQSADGARPEINESSKQYFKVSHTYLPRRSFLHQPLFMVTQPYKVLRIASRSHEDGDECQTSSMISD